MLLTNHTSHPSPRLLVAGVLACLSWPVAAATTWTVNSETGLRNAMATAANGDTIAFTGDITLTGSLGDLTAIVNNLTIDGGGRTLNANGARGFFAYSGTSTIANLTITGAVARGGN